MPSAPDCPRCGAPLPSAQPRGAGIRERWPDFPFCSRRCRLIDLGAWFDEAYRIPGASLAQPGSDGTGDGSGSAGEPAG